MYKYRTRYLVKKLNNIRVYDIDFKVKHKFFFKKTMWKFSKMKILEKTLRKTDNDITIIDVKFIS